ncbi:multidrug resistance protein [Coprinopsis cinerea okayama7|uniref:Multidrug resistance protein n=1 Tax=Coprinopsis cinerea (strain Okayama-7 / 130 / ATCC MYA-4618 / FGSC 9003) TaxID=240176 RepID=D6RQZ1_COPC7|nr:multidrug resistance protein [Coprinopsis cinerea okayama7\|eukprot:XP_002910068.1 multidrug resistance protein [Coprinopsis cinerea okayama7\
MSQPVTERDRLLPIRKASNGDIRHGERRPLGPLEISRGTRYRILAGIWTATFLSALNQTLVPTMLPSISSEFNKSNQASWLGTSYLLATCTFTPLYGRLSNVLGRKGANHTALIFAGLGVLLCGLSTNMETLILARFLSGIGGGGLMTTSSIIVSDMYTLRSRGLTQGVQSVFNGLGMGFGGPLGGLVTDWLGWRWAFIIQMPLFIFSYVLTTMNLNYVTEGKGKSTREILKRIDYGGSATLLMAVGSCLLFLSARYNEGLEWSSPSVTISASLTAVFSILFIIVEIWVAPEPVLAPFLLKQKIPVLVGISNFLVATCNFSIMYFLPMWFQTVILTSASIAGLHLLPNSLSMSVGSLFAGWMMHVTGRYKLINLIFGALPFIGASLIYRLQEDSGFFVSWFSIVPLGFGNAVVLQTMLIALLVHLPESYMAVGTGFGQLFRGIGQVGGVAVSSAVFQSILDSELRKRLTGPDTEFIMKIRQNSRLIASPDIPAHIKEAAKESYKISLKSVFFFASCMTLLAYIVRLPIPDKHLDHEPKREHTHTHRHHQHQHQPPSSSPSESSTVVEPSSVRTSMTLDRGAEYIDVEDRCELGDSESEDSELEVGGVDSAKRTRTRKRRLSTYDMAEDVADPEMHYGTPRV